MADQGQIAAAECNRMIKPLTTVLLVEDNPGDARLIREIFEGNPEHKIALTHVECMSDAEKELARLTFDIVVLDLGLPDAQGLEAVQRAHAVAPHLPLVVLTGVDDESLGVKAMQQGAQDYLAKGQLDKGGFWRALRYAMERKTAELAQRRSEESYRLLFDVNPHPMWVVDLESNAFLSVNDAAVRTYGYSREEFLGMTGRDLRTPEASGGFAAHFALFEKRSAQLGAGGVIKHRKKSGEVIEVEIGGGPLIFNGRAAVLGLANDVTARTSLQAQLHQAQKLESLGLLAGGVAHDLNNLMGVVLGYGGLTLDQLEPASPLRQNVERMQKAASQAVSIVQQLLAFSRKQIQQPRMLSLNAIVENVKELLQRLLGDHIRVSIETDPNLGTAKVDPGQFEQVIMNLALNARDAMPEGGRLRIRTANVELNQADPRSGLDSPAGPLVMLEVSDTGSGMDAKTQARIFEPFFTTKGPFKGTGLGLSTAYGIVKQSGGSISVHSEPGHGATFNIYLPRVEGAPRPLIVENASEEIPGGSETVLLVEDFEPLRKIARQFLLQGGYTVLAAADGTAALAASRNHPGPIHLLLTDVAMPGLSGPQLARELCPARPGMEVLFISGYTDDALGRHGVLEAGVALLEKPFTRGALLRKLRQLLDPAKSSPRGELR